MATDFFGIKKGLNIKPATLPVTGALGDIAYDIATSTLKQWNGASWGTIAGSNGLPNLITNGDAEGLNPIVTYKDAAGTRPVDGTGGSPTTVTSSISATTPILGLYSFLLSKSAANGQGEGWSIPLDTILPAYKAKVLNITFDYLLSSGTFIAGSTGVDSDVIVYLYDVTNSVLLEPSSIKLLSNSTTLTDKFRASFQTSSNSTSYRLIFHVTSALSNAFVLQVDNISVSPSQYIYGSPVTDYQSFTGSIIGTSSGTLNIGSGGGATKTMEWARDGQDILLRYYVRIGTSGTADVSGAYILPLPSGITLLSAAYETVGYGEITVIASANPACRLTAKIYGGGFILDNGDTTILSNGGSLYNNANLMSVTVRAKVTGWSSSVQMSDQTDTRVVAFAEYKSVAQTVATATYAEVTSYDATSGLTIDTHNGFNRSTGRYTVPVAGIYRVSGIVHWTNNTTGHRLANIWKNGSFYTYGVLVQAVSSGDGTSITADALINCVAGDTISMACYQTSGGNLDVRALGNATKLTIERLTGPSAIAATEDLYCEYTNSAGTSIANNSSAILDFAVKELDSHSAWTTGASAKFTAPINGVYEVCATAWLTNGGGWTAGEEASIDLYKNGSVYSRIGSYMSNAAHAQWVPIQGVPKLIRLLAGEYIDFRIYQNSGGAIALIVNGSLNRMSIKRVGN